MDNLPLIYANCKAGCSWPTVHRSEFEQMAALVKQYPEEDGTYILEKGKEYKIFAPKTADKLSFDCDFNLCFETYGIEQLQKVSILCNDEYADSFVFKLLDVIGGMDEAFAVYEISGTRYKESVPTLSIFTRCKVSGSVSVYAYNSDATLKSEKAEEYAIGFPFVSDIPTHPNERGIAGTWLEIPQGHTIIGAGSEYPANSTGGTTKHSHNSGTLAALFAGDSTSILKYHFKETVTERFEPDKMIIATDAGTSDIQYRYNGIDVEGNTGEANNMSPYIAMYMWIRIA